MAHFFHYFLPASLAAILSCFHLVFNIPREAMEARLGLVDPSSYSNSNAVVVTDVSLFLNVDFSKKVLAGRVELSCLRKVQDEKELILDSKDLIINNITSEFGEPLHFTLSSSYKTFGSSLTVDISTIADNPRFKIIIHYETSPTASGLQWLSPQQTLGKKEPYMFSQFQPNHARSVLPCQDTPSVKITYTAELTAPEPFTILMSALHDGKPRNLENGRKLASFRQPVAIPSYLIAFAVGRITSRRISDQISVWAEPESIDAAADEFAEADKMLNAAVELCGPYEWGVYDLLVMPPSFPFGGMENPCLTFVTPTVLAGDKSLVDVVAHEISHSWSGNLVSTKTFEHFWLNEGWTMFIERKIHEKLSGTAARHFDATLGLESLKETVEHLGVDSEFTKLVPNLTDTDPDDAFSTVPYEKGHSFLFYLEQLVGGADIFNPFIKSYFANFRNTSITTNDFKQFFVNYFKDREQLKTIDWDGWLYGKGMPLVMPEYDNTLSKVCVDLADQWSTGRMIGGASNLKPFTTSQIILFLSKLLEGSALSVESLRELGELYPFNESRNSEVRFRWLRLGLKAHASEFVPKALEFVNEQGRMKFVRPIYRDLYDWEAVRQQAIDNYNKNKEAMMFVLSNQLLKDLHITQ